MNSVSGRSRLAKRTRRLISYGFLKSREEDLQGLAFYGVPSDRRSVSSRIPEIKCSKTLGDLVGVGEFLFFGCHLNDCASVRTSASKRKMAIACASSLSLSAVLRMCFRLCLRRSLPAERGPGAAAMEVEAHRPDTMHQEDSWFVIDSFFADSSAHNWQYAQSTY